MRQRCAVPVEKKNLSLASRTIELQGLRSRSRSPWNRGCEGSCADL